MKLRIRGRYYKQILLTLLVISLIPVLFLGYYVYSFMNQQMEEMYKSYASRLERQKDEFETNFQYVEVALLRLALNSTYQNAVNKERQASDFQTFNTIKKELQTICNTETYLEDIYLISESQNWIMGETFFIPLDTYANEGMIRELLDCRQASFWRSDGNYLYLCKKVPVNVIDGNGMLLACFDKDIMIREIVGQEEEGILIIQDKDGQILLTSREDAEILKAVESPDESKRLYSGMDIINIRHQNQHYTVLKSDSDRLGWTYTLVMPSETILANIRGILWMAGLIVLGLFTTDVLAILTLSRRLYRPIDKMDSAIRKGKSEDPESDDGMELMDRVQHMVDENVEMNRRLSHGKRDRQQLFLRRVYQGEILNPDWKKFEENGFNRQADGEGTYFVMAVRYHDQFKSAEDRHLYLFALDNIVNELIRDEDSFPPVIIGSIMYLTCRVSTDSNESAVMKVQMMAIMITTTVKKYMNMSLNIGISQGFVNLQNITLGINESNRALQNALKSAGGVNFYHSHHTTSENAKGYAAKKKREQLLHYIDLGDREACKAELDAYISGVSDLYYYMFKLELCKLVSEILNIYYDYSLVPDYDKVGDIIDFDIGKTVNTYERLRDYLWDHLLDPLFDAICSQTKERDQWQQIIEYLLDNLEKDISLEECARYFNYNANYLSRWFKKKMGMTYTEFVTGKKVEACKTLLVESDISVNELAERFGYSSPQNFIRVFKKYTLMTPGQYRRAERDKLNKF